MPAHIHYRKKLSLSTLEYITNVHSGKLHFVWLAKKANSINLNAQHENGMTNFDSALESNFSIALELGQAH